MESTGVAIFDPSTYDPIHITSIVTKKKDTHGKRLYHIAAEVHKLREKYPPGRLVMERGFSRFNTSTQVIYRAHGLFNYLFHDVEQVYYPPKKVKEAIIRGDASKKVVRQIIEKKYPDIEFANEDESDAVSIGICDLIINKSIQWDKKSLK
jgi:Holliday junction resolvasome RuvABC endonuclease subunit